ncbi:MAG: hypothetical protein IT330_04420 [Anaerolineae bacterium]|nr:hypothetical protein [Anaerolineae bacterium]
MHRSLSPLARHGLVIAAYTLLALALTYPLVTRFATHVPGDGIDDPALGWNLWWVRHALVDLRVNPFDCEWMFYPIGINLAFYTLTVLNGVLSIPLQEVIGLVPASNVILLSSYVLGGYGTYLLVMIVLASRTRGAQVGAFVAGFVYAFASSKLFYAALGQFNIASSQWIPFTILYLWKMKERPARLRYPLLAAIFLVLQAWAELTYASFLLIFIALFGLWMLVGMWQRRADIIMVLRNLALVGLVFLIGIMPILANMLPDLRAEGDFFTSGGGFADVFSADLAGYLVPTMHHPLLGDLVRGLNLPHDKGQQLYLGYSVLLLAGVGLWAGWRGTACVPLRGAARFWALSFALFFLLTLGPTLRLNGHDTGLPLPFAIVEQLPFFKGNRYPSRYSVLLVLSAAMLAGFGVAALWQAKRALRRIALPILCALVAFEHLSVPLPLSDFRVPPVYQRIAQEPGDFAVLELPLGWRNGARVMGTQEVIIMWVQWYQTAHGKRLLGGNTSRNPEFKFQYFAEAPVLNSLIALETGRTVDDATRQSDRAIAPLVMQFLNVRYVVAHTAKLPPAVLDYVEATLPVEHLATEGDIRLYRVIPPAPTIRVERPATPWGRLALAEGWSLPDAEGAWAQRDGARLLFPMTPETQHLRLRLRAPGPGQWLVPVFNGRHFPYIILTDEWRDYTIDLPAWAHRPGPNELELRFKRLYPVPEPAADARMIGTTGVSAPRYILVSSAGLDVGDFGHVYLDGAEVSPNQRGYNLVSLDAGSGRVLAVETFDTNAVITDSARLVDFVAAVPDGAIVAGAAADEAAYSLTGEAMRALQQFGIRFDMRGHFRWSHAFIGVKGAAAGTALEAWSETRPVHVFAGIPASEPRLAAALSEFELRP